MVRKVCTLGVCKDRKSGVCRGRKQLVYRGHRWACKGRSRVVCKGCRRLDSSKKSSMCRDTCREEDIGLKLV
jgi:hypothetical protein